MANQFSRRAANLITIAVLLIVAATLALDAATGFSYDHWRDTVMATF